MINLIKKAFSPFVEMYKQNMLKEKKTKRLSALFYNFSIDDKFVSYAGGNGSFRVYKKDIESVSLDANKIIGVVKLKINGKGTILAEVQLPTGFGKKAQEFIYDNLSEKHI